MPDYDFKSLNGQDFEHLVRDLLNAELRAKESSVFFSSFAAGRDREVDLLDSISAPPTYNCIVQVKHYANTSYSTLLSHLTQPSTSRKSELDKIHQLHPHRLIVATSLNLTLANKEEIFRRMQPYVRGLEDIIDQQELNRLLGLHVTVEENHPKLWFCSASMLQRIMHNHISQRSAQLVEDIQRKMRLFVPVNSLSRLLGKLKDFQVLVLRGEPGCGKTTIAEFLVYRLLSEENAKAYWIDRSIDEIEKLLTEDNEPQIFYFDDFLGHTRTEIDFLRTKEKGLLHFIHRIQRMTNKYLVMTTRTLLLNEAVQGV